MIKKIIFYIIPLFFPVVLQSQFFGDPSYSEKDKKVIEKIVEIYPLQQGKKQLQFSKTICHFIEKNPTENAASAEIICNVFIALENADGKDKLNTCSTYLFEKALKLSQFNHRKDLEIWVSLHYAFYYYTYRKYEKCFPLFLLCMKNLEQTDDENIIQISETYKKIAYFLTTTEDYTKARDYLLTAQKYAPKKSSQLAGILNALGLCSLHHKKLKEAANYYQEALKVSTESRDELRYAKVLGSIAEVEIIKNNPDIAIKLLQQDIAISKKLKSDQNTMYALKVLSTVYLQKKDIPNAEKYILEAKEYAQSKAYFKRSEFDIYEIILKIAEFKKDNSAELQARRKLEQLKDSLQNFDGKEIVLKVGWESQKKQLQQQIENEKAKIKEESYLKIAAFATCFLLVLALVILVKRFQKTIKNKKSEYETKVLNLMVDKRNSEDRLNATNKTLDSYQTYLSEKNSQIEALEEEIKKIKTSSSYFLEKKSGEMQKLLESHLMTDENWHNFKKAFTEKYPAEYESIVTTYPHLTESNLRIIFLSKLDMNNAEISRLLGVTLDAVKKAKHRLRKKYENNSDGLFKTIH